MKMDEKRRKDERQAGKTESEACQKPAEEDKLPDLSTLPRCPDDYSFEIGV